MNAQDRKVRILAGLKQKIVDLDLDTPSGKEEALDLCIKALNNIGLGYRTQLDYLRHLGLK